MLQLLALSSQSIFTIFCKTFFNINSLFKNQVEKEPFEDLHI